MKSHHKCSLVRERLNSKILTAQLALFLLITRKKKKVFVLVQATKTEYCRLGSLNKHWFLTVLKAGSQGASRIRYLVRGLFLTYRWPSILSCSHTVERKILSCTFYKVTNPIHVVFTFMTSSPPKHPTLLRLSLWGLGFQLHKLERGNKHSVHNSIFNTIHRQYLKRNGACWRPPYGKRNASNLDMQKAITFRE